ncbi:MAG: hypothetical protein J7K48_08930 [Thermococcus sp.]|nr:hypothetical protein [Thermococcus sp.]
MRKLVAVLFGLLVVAAGLAAATTWEVTRVDDYTSIKYGWAYAFVDVKYDVMHPYTNYEITYRGGNGGLTEEGEKAGYTAFNYNIPDSNGIESVTLVKNPITNKIVEQDIASAGWPYI